MSSAASSLKEIVTIVCGLAAAGAVANLLAAARGSEGQIVPDRLGWGELALFSALILLIARFYHGNVRHLDEEYEGGVGRAFVKLRIPGSSARITADFFVILTQSLMLASLGYLLRDPVYFGYVIVALLALDALWFFFFHTPLDSHAERSKHWALNNIVFAAILAITLYFSGRLEELNQSALPAAISLLILVNSTLDFVNQRSFYFPSRFEGIQRIFIAAPMTAHLDPDGGFLDTDLMGAIKHLVADLRAHKFVVVNAHEREEWGDALMEPQTALWADLDEVTHADLLVAIMQSPPSPGVQLELGAALALRKPVLQLRDGGVLLDSYLNRALEHPALDPDIIAKSVSAPPNVWGKEVRAFVREIEKSSSKRPATKKFYSVKSSAS